MAEHDAYQRAVCEATQFRLKDDVDYFLETFKEDKESVILLPGGGGSNLWHADKKFDQVSDPRNYVFDLIWLDLGIAFGDAKAIKIGRNGRDVGERVIVGDGDVSFFRARPYIKAMNFFRRQANFNAVLIGFDWRRNLFHSVDTLRDVIMEIKKTKPPKVMKKLFVVGHSLGGLVAKLFFQTHQDLAREIGGMISVGTPFYGYLGQLRRIFEGEPQINRFYNARTVATISSSWPGLYTVLPIDKRTYDDVGGQIGADAYPVTALDGTPADAYDENAPSSRFPNWVWIKQIEEGRKVRKLLSKELPDPLKSAVYHIRSKIPRSTPVTAKWKQKLPRNYDPDNHPSPMEIGVMGDGDETIPYWSAALASADGDNVRDFSQGEHMALMAQSFVLRHILKIVSRDTRSVAESDVIAEYGPDPQMATREELDILISQIDWSAPGVIGQLDTLIPERYAWRFLQEIAM